MSSDIPNPAILEQPVILVGQPRSGSTLLSRILNEDTGVFLINDFYALQKVDAENLWGELSASEALRVAGWIYERIHIRATQEAGKTLGQSIELTAGQLAKVEKIARGPFPAGARWHDILDAIMSEAASQAGCTRWGYNTPQDYLHLERIFAAFPQARIIFLLRAPQKVLSSYKNASGPWHEPRRYNPATVAMAWKSAASSYEYWRERKPGQVHFMRYEDLVEKQEETVAELGRFLSIDFKEMDFSSFGKNTSFERGKVLKTVTPSELRIFEIIAGDVARKRGYEFDSSKFQLTGIVELGRVFARSSAYAAGEIMTNKDRRKRILRLFGLVRN